MMEYWPEMSAVFEVHARDTLPNGAYRIAKRVSGTLERAQAQKVADTRNAQVSQEYRLGTGLIYVAWSALEIDKVRRWGTTIISG